MIDRRLLVLALGMFALGTDSFVMAGVLSQISHAFAVPVGAAGQMTTVYALTYALMAPTVAAIAAHKLPASALPAVTFLKAPGYQDGHAAYSDPADEQAWLVKEVNALQQTSDWSSTAVMSSSDDAFG